MPELLNLLSTGSPARTTEGSLSVRSSERALIVARSSPCDERSREMDMIQYAALLGNIQAGLSDIHHPLGNSVYVVRDDQSILYIGQTVIGEWDRIRRHLRTKRKFGQAVVAHGPAAARWRVEVCNFGGESGADVLERELIRRYRPLFNMVHNTGRPHTVSEQLELRNRAVLGQACLRVLDAGWPSFCDVVLESLHDYPPGTRVRRHNR